MISLCEPIISQYSISTLNFYFWNEAVIICGPNHIEAKSIFNSKYTFYSKYTGIFMHLTLTFFRQKYTILRWPWKSIFRLKYLFSNQNIHFLKMTMKFFWAKNIPFSSQNNIFLSEMTWF